MDLEQIEKVLLSVPEIEYLGHTGVDKYGFSRTISFILNDITYEIEWYHNISYLKMNDVVIMFNRIEHTNTWPHKFKSELRFKFLNNGRYYTTSFIYIK